MQKIGSLGEGRKIKRLEDVVGLVNTFEPELEDLSEGELRAKTAEFRARLQDGETLDDILPEAFACAREAARRSIGQRHFDVQILGGIVLHQGKIAEMKTGEGKTLTSTMPAYLNALAGRGVHVVTVNDYLAKRDSEWMGGIYRALGVSVGLIQANMSPQRAASRLRRRHHLRHQQRVRLRLPARQHGDAGRGHGPAARARVRDRRRGGLDPDRRGAHPADHQRHGRGLRQVVPDVRAAGSPAAARRRLRDRRGQANGRRQRVGRREGRGRRWGSTTSTSTSTRRSSTTSRTRCAPRSCTSATSTTS